jgi:hypothetical protein
MSREWCSFVSSDADRGDTLRHRALVVQRQGAEKTASRVPSPHKNQRGVFDLRALLRVLLLEFARTLAALPPESNTTTESVTVAGLCPPVTLAA